jgi:two-component system cell cycle sensor histidine kinase/response regulator CckA
MDMNGSAPLFAVDRGCEGIILLVEDEEHLRQLSSAVLERAGFTVFQAGDAKEAAEIWQQDEENIDLLIADILVPGLSGPEIAIQFRKSRPGLRVIFTSGNDRKTMVETEQMVRGAKFVRKPFTVKELLDLVRAELREKG